MKQPKRPAGPRPRWDYREEATTTWIDGLSPEQADRLRALLATTDEKARRFVHEFVLARAMIYSNPQDRPPTAAQNRAAARQIMRRAAQLRERLEGGAGGLVAYLDAYARPDNKDLTAETSLRLGALERACERAIRETEIEGGDLKPDRHEPPKLQLARRLAYLFETELEEKPTRYCDPNYEDKRGKFAHVLDYCIKLCEEGCKTEELTPKQLHRLVMQATAAEGKDRMARSKQ